VAKTDISDLLRHHAVLLDLLGEDSFRVKAFENAARLLDISNEPLDVLIAEHRVASLRGIGKTLTAVIEEIATKGSFAEHEQARERVPLGVLDLLRVEGLGPKKARTLWREANITSLDELEAALIAGTVDKLSGFGGKTAQKFLASIAFLKTTSGRHWRHRAARTIAALQAELKAFSGIDEIFIGGSWRRGCETIGDLDAVLIAKREQHEAIRTAALQLNGAAWKETAGIFRGEFNSFPVEFSIVAPEQAAVVKLLVTGSKDHVRALQDVAAKRGINLNDESFGGAKTESEIYAALGLEFVPPPLRETAGTVVTAGSRRFPTAVAYEDLKGILHCHTTASDGRDSLRAMAEAMIARGFEFLGIADHSQAAAYARGLTPERVREQWREIDKLNSELKPFRILKGTEVDIQAGGLLDFDDDLLAGFDFVIASVHSGFNMTEEEATARVCRALENPHVDILGHPTGRLLLERNGYPLNHERGIACAAQHGKGIEFNCNPHRFDIDWRWLSLCEEMHVPVPLCPDAHDIAGLCDISFGVDVAAKGPLTAANCATAWSAEKFVDWCQSHT
jgi:DNA polymerase (family X)